jgi:hypothetical protein
MKIKVTLLLVFLSFSCKGHIAGKVSNKQKIGYILVISDAANEVEKNAARILQGFYQKRTDEKLPILKESLAKTSTGIFIGNTDAFKKMAITSIKPNGFIISKSGNNIVIGGNGNSGTLNGVYAFLERYLGISCLAPGYYDIPKSKDIALPDKIKVQENPAFEISDVYTDIAYDSAYASWHANGRLLLNHDRKIGTFVHTFLRMVPPVEYLKSHPEYYAFNNGKRSPTQLCMSNNNVAKIFVDTLKQMMAKHPAAKFWSVSQEDIGEFCHCENCKKAYAKYGGKISGLLVEFVNKIAVNFPDKYITTLAYHETIEPPINVKPAKNVVIYYAPIDALHSKSYTDDPANYKYVKFLKGWRTLSDNLLFWDYVCNYTDVLAPYPNINTYKENILLFKETGVKYVYEEGVNQPGGGGDLRELKSFLLCKLLWNPSYDQDSLTNLFCNKYYGAAAPFILKYIRAIQGNALNENVKLKCFGGAEQYSNSYLKPAYLKQYDDILRSAASVVASDNVHLDNVNKLRISLDYYIIKMNKKGKASRLLISDKGLDNNSERIERFKKYSKKNNIKFLRDQKQDPIEKFYNDL